jgi:hypothetical protein
LFRGRFVFAFALVCWSFLDAPTAFAQTPRQSIVVSVEPKRGDPVPSEWPGMLRRALVARRDRNVLGATVLAERLRVEGRPARQSTRAPAALRKEADAVLEAAAFGHDSQAISQGRVLLGQYQRDIDALGASDDAARAIADTCLFVVRALLHQENSEGARLQARECAWLVPDLTMSADLHPPEVQALFASARSEQPLARLTVRAETSEATECVLRLQGRPVSRLPASLKLVPAAYTVQTECEHAGYVRELQLEPNELRHLETAPDLEAALQAQGAGLRYSNAPPLAAGRRPALALLTRWVRADELWTVERRGEAAAIRRFVREDEELVEIGGRLVPAAPAATFESRVQAAVAAIDGGNLAAAAPRRDDSEATPTTPMIATAGAIGGAFLVASSWFAFARTASLENELDTMTYDEPTYAAVLERRDIFRTLALTSSAAGSALVAGTAFAWLPQQDGIPWWAFAAGAAGTLAASVGTVLWLQHGELATTRCPNGEVCARPRSTVPLGPMLLTQGLGLLSLPATYAVRGSRGASASIGLRASSTTLSLAVGGTL